MKGVVAAGSQATAEAGAEILERGGNAVDAAVAACFAMSAGEPALTSLAGGGMIIHRHGESGEVTICDCFANAPGLGLSASARPPLDFFSIELQFGAAEQTFHVGRGAAAVAGVLPGLCASLERWGALPLEEVVAPACQRLRQGVPIEPPQAFAIELLTPLLLHTEPGRRQFGVEGRPDGRQTLGVDEIYRAPMLAETFEDLAARGWRRYYDEIFGPALLAGFGPEAGGLITPADLERFEVTFRAPLAFDYRDTRVYSSPPPSLGGSMIGLMLSLLQSCAPQDLPDLGSVEHVRLLGHVMRLADEMRSKHGRLADASGVGLDPEVVAEAAERLAGEIGAPLCAAPEGAADSGTSHVSVIDEAGNAVAITFSHGEGNGYMVGETGIVMNNIMGEADLHPGGFHRATPGERLPTMMSPSVLVGADGSLVALGTGGANRIRTAMTQVLSNLIGRGFDPQRATAAPRIHFEAGMLAVEAHEMDPAVRDAGLDSLGAAQIGRFVAPNLFFGGVHLAHRSPDGTLSGGGDPRRGGAVRVVC